MEQARRNLLRRKRLAATTSSIRFRKNDARATRRAAEENACARKGLGRDTGEASTGAPLVIEAPSSSTSPSPSKASIDPTLQAWREWREKNRSVISHLKRQETIRKNRECVERRLAPHWTKAKEIDRAPAYMAVILETGMATSFTLNFSPDVLRAAEKAKEGAFHNLRSRITRELRKTLGDSPRLVCGLDRTASGRLHIHGALVLDPGQRPAAVAALRRAGGKWAKGNGQRHQLHMQADQWSLIGEDFLDVQQPLDAGWAGYCVKIAKRLRNDTNHSVLYASPEIKRRAQELYNGHRNQSKPNIDNNLSINTDFQTTFVSEKALVGDSQIAEYDLAINQTRIGVDENTVYGVERVRRAARGHAAGRLRRRDDQRRHACRHSDHIHSRLPHHRQGRPERAGNGALHASPRRTDPSLAQYGGRDRARHLALQAARSRSPGSPEKGRLMPTQGDKPQSAGLVDLGFKVPETLRLRFKLEAVRRRTTMRQLFEDAFRLYLDQRPAPPPDDKF